MITIVSHDAGGAEILSSYLQRLNKPACCVLDGPALPIFSRKCPNLCLMTLEEALKTSRMVLCGTSWQSDLEWMALRCAREQQIPSAAFLDHWVNYRNRFVRNGEETLPDEIWVGDEHAYRLAKEVFSSPTLRRVRNPYLDDVCADLITLSSIVSQLNGSGKVVLYICEPVREHALRQHGVELYWGYSEESAAMFFLANILSLVPDLCKIVVRPHPSESVNKYAWMASYSPVHLELSVNRSLVHDIASADIVVGCESMAMVVALSAGKPVYSSIPAGGRPCQLPQEEIESIASLIIKSNVA